MSEFELHTLQKICSTQYFLLPNQWSKRFSFCVNPMPQSLNPSLIPLPFVPLWIGFSPLWGTAIFLTLNSFARTPHLPCYLPPAM